VAEFHFIRPLWLIGLPVGIWLIWKLVRRSGALGRWHELVDDALKPYVLTAPDLSLKEHNWLTGAAIIAWVLATVALAGPTWERLPVPAYRSSEALVVALDLSRSMDAGDLQPTRLARAKLKLLSLLERRASGQTGLIVFSAHAFTVSPLTADTETITALVSSLTSDIMPSRGSYPEAGVNRAIQIMRQTGISQGEVLLMTDSAVSPGMEALAQELREDGFILHVMAIGTAEGGPIAQPRGGFLTDNVGQVVVSQVDLGGLERLANLGGGRFSSLTPDDRDLDYLFPISNLLNAGASESMDFQTDVWRDQGPWLSLLLVPLVALAFKRGWIVLWVVGIILPGTRAEALTWDDLWLRADQQGQAAFEAEEHQQASELFQNPEWRAAAQYRAGDFAASASSLENIETAEAHYNRGNALARAGAIPEAINAYDLALELESEHEDAIFNRDLLLQQQPQESPNQEGQQGENSEQDSSDDGQEESEGDSQESQEDTSSQSAEGGESEPQDSEDPEQVAESDQEDSIEGTPLPTAEELEEWASEQAADQWLRRIPQDPGGLLRRKFLYQYQRLGVDQDGNYVWPGDEEQPW
tara:strand:+ start:431 stop:2185 length:1755 start_codon:yes stop_codon:yes gene_type:complete